MPVLAILHSATVTVEPLRELATEVIPAAEIINFVDDSILRQLARNGGNLAEVEDRLAHYARFAQAAGAGAILVACSSVGELVEKLRRAVAIPVIRIDAAVAREAVDRGSRIGVATTLPTTLRPTTALLQAAARGRETPIVVEPLLVEGAFEKLVQGDPEGHDALLVPALMGLAGRVDVVVLAHVSMARVLPSLSNDSDPGRFLAGPHAALMQVKEALDRA